MIPYASLPHGYGYFSDPYSSISINAGGGSNGGAGGYSDYNTVGFNQARIFFSLECRGSAEKREWDILSLP